MTYQTLEAQVASLSFHAYLHHNLVTSLLKLVFEVIMGEEYTQKVFVDTPQPKGLGILASPQVN